MEAGGSSQPGRRKSSSRSDQDAAPSRRVRHIPNPQNFTYYSPDTPTCLSTEDALNAPYTPYTNYYPYNEGDETQPPSQHIYSQEVNIGGQEEAWTTPTSRPPQNRTRSKIWNYFTKLEMTPGDDSRRARCNICGTVYILDHGGGGGTGSLKRHLQKKHSDAIGELFKGIVDRVHDVQYNHDIARQEMARYVPSQRQPFTFAEKPDFVRLVQNAFNPEYRRIPRSTLVRDIKSLYYKTKESLVNMFRNMDAHVSLTSDSWTSPNGLNVVGITCHWIDSDWIMQKRIISFQSVLTGLSAQFLYSIIVETIDEFSISTKIISFTYDNGQNFVATIPFLKEKYGTPINAEIFHQRCICHTFQLIVRHGLHKMKLHVEWARLVISFIRRKKACQKNWQRSCNACGMRPNLPPTECSTRWNTVLYMLQYLYEHRQVLYHYASGLPSDYKKIFNAKEDLLEEVRLLIDFLIFFEKWTVTFSGSYYPTSHLVIQALTEMIGHINKPEFKNVPSMVEYVTYVKNKIKKYYDPVPMTYSLAHLLDPRFKKTCLLQALTIIYTDMGHTVQYATERYKEVLVEELAKYDNYTEIAARHVQHVPVVQSTNPFLSMINYQGAGTSQTSLSDLDIYYSNACIPYTDDFDILDWWRENSHRYKTLSIMAKDLLTIQTSSVASESAFSHGKQQLTPYRAALAGSSLEMIVCIKDWMDAETRTQGLALDKEENDPVGLTTPEGTNTPGSQEGSED